MMSYTKLVGSLVLAASLVGCGGGAYQQGSWARSSAEADWDIDSAVCLQSAETLNNEDRERITEIEESADALADTASGVSQAAQYNELAGYGDSGLTDVANTLSTFSGLFSGTKKSSAESQVQEEKFVSCMLERGWKQ